MHKQNENKLCKVKGIVLNDVHAEVELWMCGSILDVDLEETD